MKIVLFSPYPCLSNIGTRLLSSALKREGHIVRLIFAPFDFEQRTRPDQRLYPESMRRDLTALCSHANLVGVTLMTDFYHCAIQVTSWIKDDLHVPVVWGGVHPTLAPEECARHADFVVLGEGEEVIVELASALESGADPSGIQSLCMMRGEELVSNSVRALQSDLNALPIPDYAMTDHFILHEGAFKPLTHDLLRENFWANRGTFHPHLQVGYQILTGRGCPHKCTYCINHALKNLHGTRGYLRWRSVESVIRELEMAVREMPYLDHVWISDDAFFSRKLSDLEEFASSYRERIGLPFTCLTSPATLSEDKLQVLMDAGLASVQMGVQTLSKNTSTLYNRGYLSQERILEAMRILARHADRIGLPHYDFIIENPFETMADELETLRFMARMPRPYAARLFVMQLYPGTFLFQEAERQGLIPREGDMGDRWHQVNKSRNAYTRMLFGLFKRPMLPVFLCRALTTRPLPELLGSGAINPLINWSFEFMRRVKRARARRVRI